MKTRNVNKRAYLCRDPFLMLLDPDDINPKPSVAKTSSFIGLILTGTIAS